MSKIDEDIAKKMLHKGVITNVQYAQALLEKTKSDKNVIDILISNKIIDKELLSQEIHEFSQTTTSVRYEDIGQQIHEKNLKKLEGRITKLTKDKNHWRQCYYDERRKRENKDVKIFYLTEELQKLEDSKKSQQNANVIYEKTLEKTKKKLQENEVYLEENKKRLQNLNEKYDKQLHLLEKKNDELKKIKETKSIQERKLAELQAKKIDQFDGSESMFANLKKEFAEVLKNYEVSNQTIQEKDSEIEELRKSLDELQDLNLRLRIQKLKQEKEISIFKKNEESIQQKLIEKKEEYSLLLEENDDLKRRMSSFQDLIENDWNPGNWKEGTKIPGCGYTYNVISKIGEGSFGKVFKVKRSDKPNRIFVMKSLDGHDEESKRSYLRFMLEARTLMGFEHPHIIKGIDCYQSKDLSYCVMEHVDGISLEQMIVRKHYYQKWSNNKLRFGMKETIDNAVSKKEYPNILSKKNSSEKYQVFDVKLATAITLQLAKALSYLHYMGLVHRDLKPANVIVCSKLFEIEDSSFLQNPIANKNLRKTFKKNGYDLKESASIKTDDDENWYVYDTENSYKIQKFGNKINVFGETNDFWGNVPHANAENVFVKLIDFGTVKDPVIKITLDGDILGTVFYMAPEAWEGNIEKKSDIYSLGILYFEMLMGYLPYKGKNIQEIYINHMMNNLPRMPKHINKDVKTVVKRMTSKKIDQRLDADEVIDELEQLYLTM